MGGGKMSATMSLETNTSVARWFIWACAQYPCSATISAASTPMPPRKKIDQRKDFNINTLNESANKWA